MTTGNQNVIEVFVGKIGVGGNYPVSIQSMTNTSTHDIEKTLDQIIRIWHAGADFVRITIPNAKDLEAIKKIKEILQNRRGGDIPLVADIHFLPKLAIQAAAIVDKVRINPGNFAELNDEFQNNEEKQKSFIKAKIIELISVCNRHNTSVRIGVNHGSLSERMLQKYGDTPQGMVASVMEYLEIFRELNFNRIIISLKSSNPLIMIYANRLLQRTMNERGMSFPLHLGVTEAGDGEDGRVKSAIGIGTLLTEGIGNTIRVSLTEPPENEIPVAQKIVQYAGEISKNIQNGKNLILPEVYNKRHVFSTPAFDFEKRPEVIIAGNNKSVSPFDPRHLPILDEIPENFRTTVPVLVPYDNYVDLPNVFPVFTLNQLDELKAFQGEKFLQIILSGLIDTVDKLKGIPDLILIQQIEKIAVSEEIDSFISILEQTKMNNPVIFQKEYREDDLEMLQIKVAMDFGRPFVNGYGNGLFITNEGAIQTDKIKNLAFSVLQAARILTTKTEYIACPSCGRTLFDLETTTTKIRNRTSHLKGLKIAIMGCIVNGIGEMADADYGYVGGAPGKITLYKNKEVIKKNIPEEKAVNELIALIKDNGDWVENEGIL